LHNLLAGTAWDLVIVDEAHRVRNPRTSSSKLVRSLRARFMLLLTATPVENRIDDLYHLVSLVRPGHLGTLPDFRRHHVSATGRTGAPGAGGAPRGRDHSDTPEAPTGPASAGVADLAGLRNSLRSVMVRHRRSEVALMLPRRLAETIPVQPSPEEADLYRQVSERVRSEGRAAGTTQSMTLRTVQRLAGSSPFSLAPTLERMGWPQLANAARDVRSCAKSAVLTELLHRHGDAGEKVIVFTSFRETLRHLVEVAQGTGIRSSVYHGGLSRREKDAAIGSFEHDHDVLFTTESAGEGRNLQFCHAMVNFDLPWNPMLIEQRLGRIHRIGQTHDVMLTNLCLRGTIEERVLDILHAKLNLFELVVGELDMVLGRIREDFVFEQAVFDAHIESSDDRELTERLDELGTAMAHARSVHQASRAWTDDLVAELEGSPPGSPTGEHHR
jgi:SNF2 family DNA or RNA helicase